MTPQRSLEIARAAEAYGESRECVCDDVYAGTCWFHLTTYEQASMSFTAGAEWMLESEVVRAMAEALKRRGCENTPHCNPMFTRLYKCDSCNALDDYEHALAERGAKG